MAKLDWVSADQLDRTQLILQNEELRSMLADMHAVCDEHEESDGRIIDELRGERDEAMARLTVLVEAFDGECRLDHHGFYQGHLVTYPCEIAEARRFLVRHKST